MQIALLLRMTSSCLDSPNHGTRRVFPAKMETLEEIFNWLAVLWDRGFCHDNPQGTLTFLVYLFVLNEIYFLPKLVFPRNQSFLSSLYFSD